MRRIIVGVTGGSGGIYAVSLLKALKKYNIETHLVVSQMGEGILKHECNMCLEEVRSYASYYHDNSDLFASIASGSFRTEGMVIVPCSMKTLAAVAQGYSDSLLTRAADVIIKEKRTLVVVPREMPLSEIHLENMLRLSRLGARIMPPAPGFYTNPQSIEDIVNIIVGRILDQFNIEHDLLKRWGE